MGNTDDTENQLSYNFLFGKSEKNYKFNDFFPFKKEISDIFYNTNDYRVMDIELFKKCNCKY